MVPICYANYIRVEEWNQCIMCALLEHNNTQGDYPMTRYATLLTVTAFAFLAAACNTVEGVGRDVEKVGSKLEETAKDKNPD